MSVILFFTNELRCKITKNNTQTLIVQRKKPIFAYMIGAMIISAMVICIAIAGLMASYIEDKKTNKVKALRPKVIDESFS